MGRNMTAERRWGAKRGLKDAGQRQSALDHSEGGESSTVKNASGARLAGSRATQRQEGEAAEALVFGLHC